MKIRIRLAGVAMAAALCIGPFGTRVRAQTAPSAERGDHDPLEPVNRRIFWFNEQVDRFVLKPVATGYDKITPQPVQKSLSNFFANLRFPIVTVNELLQGKILRAVSDVGRFGVNTTVGILGFFDPASGWGLEQHNEDFGQTLGVWGIPPGPYLVLPFLGPSDPRDTVGLAVDSIAAVYPWFVAIQYTAAAYTVNVVNARAQVLKEVDQAKQAALDYYVFVRNAYLQRRKALVRDEAEPSAQEQENLYEVETDNDK
jgi:phospholipid-binding lipoprotein MlaA